MIPFLIYATDRERKRVPYVTYSLIGLNLLTYLGLNAFATPESFYAAQMQFGFVPAQGSWYSVMTSMFVHGDVQHLFTNMLFLWVFGALVEEGLGVAVFLTLYVGSQVAANLVHASVGAAFGSAAMSKPVIGASGAVAGLLGLAAMRFYRTRVRIAYWAVVKAGVVEIAAWIFIALWAGLEVAQAVVSLAAERSGLGGADPVAHWAHLGGFAFGIVGAAVLRLRTEGQREYLLAALRRDPLSVSGYNVMRDLQSLVREDADCGEAHHALAKQYVLDRQYEQAGRSYLRAIDCYLRQGGPSTLRHAQGGPERGRGATESYEELTALFPECRLNLRLQFRMATALEQQGRYALAVHAFERVADAYADSEEAQVSLMRAAALCAERLADPPGALDYLERLAADYPQGPWAAFARRQSARLRRELER